MGMHILIVEDDDALLDFLTKYLQDLEYKVTTATTGSIAIKNLENFDYDLILLDLTLPDISGEQVLKHLRQMKSTTPVIVLTAQNTTEAQIKNFELGADDFLPKPFDLDILIARMNARLRKLQMPEKISIYEMTINNDLREVVLSGKTLDLTKNEYNLLVYLVTHPNRVLTRTMILNQVWDYTEDVESRVVDVYMGYLRKKIGIFGERIHTVRGVGYVFKTDESKHQL